MTVAELIEKLQTYPQDAAVWMCFSKGRQVARIERAVLRPRPAVILDVDPQDTTDTVELTATKSYCY